MLAIDATQVANASNTLHPVARAKVGIRLAPGDDAHQAVAALERHLVAHTPWGLSVRVSDNQLGQPYAVDATGPIFGAARTAFGAAYEKEVVDIGQGGTIPFIAEFAAAFPAAAILVTSAGGDPDCRAHSTDESLPLVDFERACVAEALLLTELAKLALV